MSAHELAAMIKARTGDKQVAIGLILGSGLSGLVDVVEEAVSVPYEDLPGFPHAGVSGHRAELVLGRIEGVNVAVFGGRAHYYENGVADVMRLPLETLKALGAKALCVTNSAGSLREDLPPGSQMLITDHINLSGTNPLIGEPGDGRFVDMVDAYDPDLRAAAKRGAAAIGVELGEGVYTWLSGPVFETPAEIRMLKTLGTDAVGMSTVPEVILGRFLGLRCVGFSNITNMAAGMSKTALTHAQTKEWAAKSAARFQSLIKAFLKQAGAVL